MLRTKSPVVVCPKILAANQNIRDPEKAVYPIVWARLAFGYRIENLRPEHYDDVRELVSTHYMTNEVLCKNVDIVNDPESSESYLKHIEKALENDTNLVLLDENSSDSVAGVLLLQVVSKLNFGRIYSRVRFGTNKTCMDDNDNGEQHNAMIELHTALYRQIDIFEEFKCDNFMRFYLLCIKKQYRGKFIGLHLMRTALNLAGYLRIPMACGVFTNDTLQKYAGWIGFVKIAVIYYEDWLDVDGEVIFNDTGSRNRSCALMGINVPPPLIAEIVMKEVEVLASDEKDKGKKKKKKKKKKGGKKDKKKGKKKKKK